MKYYPLPENLMLGLARYLMSRPMGEVRSFVEAMEKIPPLEEKQIIFPKPEVKK